jgi:WD40 repeat protein
MRPVLPWLFLILPVALGPTVLAGEPGPQLKLLGSLEGARPGAFSNIAFSPDGKTLACGDQVTNESGETVSSVKLWDVAKRKVIATFPGDGGLPDGRGYFVAFSPDGKTLAASGTVLTLWDLTTREKKVTFKVRGPVVFSRDGRMFASILDEKTVQVWETATGKQRISLKVREGVPFSTAFSPDGKLLACGSGTSASSGRPSGGEVTIWDLATGREHVSLRCRIKLKVSLRSLSSLKADGVPKRVLLKLAALNGKSFRTEKEFEKELPRLLDKVLNKQDQRVKYLDLVRREIQPVQEGLLSWVWSVAFSPDGKTLVCGDVYGNIVLWDVRTGKRSATLQRFNPKAREEAINGVYSLAFSPDGSTLAAGTYRGIRLWDVKSGENLVSLSRPPATVWSVTFSPVDGKTLASAGSKRVVDRLRGSVDDDPTIRLWSLVISH